jgi:uncharacterized membrane protein
MPVQNFLGWAATATLFMGLSHWLWGKITDTREAASPIAFPLAMYVVNVVFAMLLSAAGGEWAPIGLALVLGLCGWAAAVRGQPRARSVRRATA